MLSRLDNARAELEAACKTLARPLHIMEVCGTHTVALFRTGIRSMLPKELRLLSGPGCPVCVTDQGYIDIALHLADRPDCLIATYGDMIRVPGRSGSLESRTTKGKVHVVLSADDAVRLAAEHADKTVVFLAVGFETTTPATAVVVREAAAAGIKNFCILCGHKRVVPAMKALLSSKNDRIDGFLCPGHVSVIIGANAFQEVVQEFGRPCVVGGFEAVQIMEALAEIARQVVSGRPSVKSLYQAVVTSEGNRVAQQVMASCFDVVDGRWRGIGMIAGSCLQLKAEYSAFDALRRFGLTEVEAPALHGCCCGEVLCGLIEPPACGLFGKACKPQSPVGPCMVSSEGVCAAWFKYGTGG
jgi:hydrogenase expression/formation protein HypD